MLKVFTQNKVNTFYVNCETDKTNLKKHGTILTQCLVEQKLHLKIFLFNIFATYRTGLFKTTSINIKN